MDATLATVLGVLGLLLWLAGAWLLLGRSPREEEITARLRALRDGGTPVPGAMISGRSMLLGALRRVGEVLRDRAILSATDLADLERTVAAAGYNPRRAVSVFIGTKATLFLALPGAGLGLATLQGDGNEVTFTLVAAVVGLMGPNWVLGFMRRSYVAALRRGVSDALDLLVVCAEAGLGLDSAVDRVARELGPSNRAVAGEFALLAHELRVLPDRRMALERLSERAPIDTLQRLAGTLSQTFRFGTPLAQALRILAAECRQDRMLRLETKAARLPAMMVLPLILFIMPCLFIVLVGPAIITLSERMGG
ncbi:type II secretion system F family protein [Falsiroseomonas tokyonensis]|uniref:Type II secretion system F family protein n=1 Tax=Falsiroseomonas tokyonensis TaxID=430521 RepID=A0ABV7BQR2_9PROT|nr:type II secretion system F family protein [Falsiroseomonas tokyonensis]MBU8537357.1 type II secretion system F family protein [Falsiroseomonas tokyonensis]